MMTAVLLQQKDRENNGQSDGEASETLPGYDSLGSEKPNSTRSNTPAVEQNQRLGAPATRSGTKQTRRDQRPGSQSQGPGPSNSPPLSPNNDYGGERKTETVIGKRVTFNKVENDRFSLLPNDRRPKPTEAPAPEEDESHDADYIVPEPLSLPSIGKEEKEKGKRLLPESSRVPSYVLAGTNRFTNTEIDAMVPRSSFSPLTPPVFVYGSFMFPSILKAQASKSIRGIYSSRYQRRLVPDPRDWARANTSLTRVAEVMTPAVLKGFDRWKPRGLRCAAIQDSRLTRNTLALEDPRIPLSLEKLAVQRMFPGHVQGFLVFGLTEEVLKTCDEIFPLKSCQSSSFQKSFATRKKGKRRGSDGSDTEEDEPPKEHFRRHKVTVDVELRDGRPRSLEAITYVWADNFGLEGPWDINDFIRRPCFKSCSEAENDDITWREEEHELAKTMKMTYTLPGDAIGHAVSMGDFAEVEALLDVGDDINGACRLYGTALQTAVVVGNEKMVRFLVEEGADVNAKGGQYHTALLAAVVCGHEEIVGLLLRRKADVLAECGRYVSALYQAISHSDEEIVYLLLEKGAWLSTSYTELLDLAAERGNQRIMDLLVEYDVRKLHIGLPAYKPYRSSLERRNKNSSRGQELSMTSGAVLRAVISQALLLKGSHGTWQGRKGVQVLKAALDAGAPEKVVDQIGDNLKTVSGLIDYFRGAVTKMLSPQPPSTKNFESSHDGDAVIEELSDTPNASDDDAALVGTSSSSARNQVSVLQGHTPTRSTKLNGSFQSPRSPANPPRRPTHRTSLYTPQRLLNVPNRPQRERAHSDTSASGPNIIRPPTYYGRRVCLACNGRGGRQGTGLTCSDCKGVGRRSASSTRERKGGGERCRPCQGSGLIFSNRDRCKECGGSRFAYA